jgi:hypothetical protein
MKLEHRKQKIASLPNFFVRMLYYNMLALLLIAISVMIGTSGYHFLGDLQWIDSFHMACMILTGMGPVAEMHSYPAKIFSSFYALYSGVAFLSCTVVLFSPIMHRILHILHVENIEDNS